jgi:hypothetical protein
MAVFIPVLGGVMELAKASSSSGSCLSVLFILILLASLLVGSGVLISRAVADLGNSAASVLNTSTEQRGLTTRTRIEWDGRVAIAEIQADAAKKTSFAFILFWVTRLLTWVAAGIMSVVAVAWTLQIMGEKSWVKNHS